MTQLGINPSVEGDKVAKDDNFRGVTNSDNVVYYSKGSGGNGVDTVYFVDTTGKACPTGIGLPEPGAPLPTSSTLGYDATAGGTYTKKGVTYDNPGLVPENMCILAGLPSSLATNATDSSDYPFGMWFANPTTLYLADEGAGDNTWDPTTGTYSNTAASTTAGLREVGVRFADGYLEPGLHHPERPQPGRSLHGSGLPHRREQRPGDPRRRDRNSRGLLRLPACATSRAVSILTAP